MLESLRIKNFRIFRDLQLSRLGRVNLLVGKNNSGKTCLLEALRVYGTRGEPLVLHELIRARNEDITGLNDDSDALPESEPAGSDRRKLALDPVRHLFHGYRFPPGQEQAIEIGPVEGGPRLRLSPGAFRIGAEELARAMAKGTGHRNERSETASRGAERQAGHLVLEEIGPDGTLQKELIWMPQLGLLDGLTVVRDLAPLMNVRFVPVRYMNEQEIAHLWDRVVARPRLRPHVVDALRLIDTAIKEVVLLHTRRPEGPVPVLLYEDGTRLPLQSLGGGTQHLFHLILATVSAEGGMVLFDELENGLHWSVQPLVWQMLFDLSVALDIQIVATTHSWDCVRAFKEVAVEHEAEAMLFHLGRSVRKSRQGEIVVTEYDKEHLERATRAGLEIR